ncbi:MAG TPA: hypothetical protein DEB40_12610 [Elusimicrobia bacterium]|nr:hypothetical protein [Elusimicrobiota bacterium]HBT62575.1 hypothetical protein [Elusimicrobiota bacterium]
MKKFVLASSVLFLSAQGLQAVTIRSGRIAAPGHAGAAVAGAAVSRDAASNTMPGLTAGQSLSPALSVKSPAAPPLVRLIVELAPDPDGKLRLGLDSKAIESVVADFSGRARMIRPDGPQAILEERAFIETDRAAASEVAARLEAAGMQVAALDDVLARMSGAASGATPMTDEELHAVAAFDNGGVLRRAEAFGRIMAAVEAAGGSNAAFSARTREEAAAALYSGLVPAIEAFNAIRGEQRVRIRAGMAPVSWTDSERVTAREHAVAKALSAPDLKDQVEPIRALVARAAAAVLDLGAPYAASWVNALLPHAEHAAAEAIASSPERAVRFIRSWLERLADGVAETAALAGSSERPHGFRRVGGLGRYVEGNRQSVVYYPKDSFRPFLPQEERHAAVVLLGMSAAAAQEWTDRFVALLIAADEAVPAIEAAERRRVIAEARRQADAMAEGFSKDPSLSARMAEQLAEMKRKYVEQAVARYEQGERIEGIAPVDRALAFLDFGPYHHLAPGFDDERYISSVADVLRLALERVSGAATLKVVIDAALSFTDDVRRWGNHDLLAARQQTIDSLERLARETALRLGLTLQAVVN